METQYQVSEPNSDYKKAIIKKTAVGTVEFSIEQIEKGQDEFSKRKRELQAELELEQAKLKNVEENHPWVLEMEEDKLFVAFFYMDIKNTMKAKQTSIDSLIDKLDRAQKEKEAIIEAVGEELGFEKV